MQPLVASCVTDSLNFCHVYMSISLKLIQGVEDKCSTNSHLCDKSWIIFNFWQKYRIKPITKSISFWCMLQTVVITEHNPNTPFVKKIALTFLWLPVTYNVWQWPTWIVQLGQDQSLLSYYVSIFPRHPKMEMEIQILEQGFWPETQTLTGRWTNLKLGFFLTRNPKIARELQIQMQVFWTETHSVMIIRN